MFHLWSRRVASSSLKKCAVNRSFSLSRAPIDVSPEVQHALNSGSAVVALESTIITHGMPYPSNLETAITVEQQVRLTGSIPATIGVLNGRIVVGLQKKQLEILSDKSTTENIKISRRDLAAAVGLKRSGGTTISATSLVASLVGIRIFSTGGLGGVHRGGEISWDVSADLTELGRTPIAVVSAGVKSILDIARTLEYLETQGVAVFTYGPNHEFPGFYSPRSGFQSPWSVCSPQEAAAVIDASRRLGLQSGMLFAAPIPEEFAGATHQIQTAVDQAVKESEENGMSKRGKEVTPWILGRVAELTGGKSIPNNIALIKNTAYIGGMIAAEYARLAKGEEKDRRGSGGGAVIPSSTVELPPSDILVIGSAAVDVISQPSASSATQTILPVHTTNPGKVIFALGGVARNMAEAAHRVAVASNNRASVLLVSPIGKDLPGNFILTNTRRLGMRTDGFISKDDSLTSAVCNMHLDINGELTTDVADMTIVQNLAADPILQIIKKHKPKLVAFDANLNSGTISAIVENCVQRNIPTFFEPTSVTKSLSIVPALGSAIGLSDKLTSLVTFISPNRLELSHLFQEIHSGPNGITGTQHWWSVMDDLNLGENYRSDLSLLSRQPTQDGLANPFLTGGLPQMAVTLIPLFQHLFIKCGENGLFMAMRITNEKAIEAWSKERTRPEKWQLVAKGRDSILLLKHYPARPLDGPIINVTGAGDSLVGSLLADLTQCENLAPESLDNIVHRAQRAAILSLYSSEAVSPLLSKADSLTS